MRMEIIRFPEIKENKENSFLKNFIFNSLGKELHFEKNFISTFEKNFKKIDFKNLNQIVSPIITLPPPTWTPTSKPIWQPTPVFEPHQLAADDFGYVFLKDATVRAVLLTRMIEITMQIQQDGINAIVFCDRGARPLAVLVAQLWSSVSDKPLPSFFFINTDPKREYRFDAGGIPEDVMQQMREWLSQEYPDGSNPLRDGHAVVRVIDESKSTGKTARFVADIVKRAFSGHVERIDCEWANVPGMPWGNRPDVIGADTVPGKFKSHQLASVQAELLTEDLIRLAKEQGIVPALN